MLAGGGSRTTSMTSQGTPPKQAGVTLSQSASLMGAFSLIQGLPAYFFTLGLPALMRDSGASLSLIGLTYVVWLPLAFKWIWAPLFDAPYVAPFGNRINWLRCLPLVMAALFGLVAAFPPDGHVWPLLVISLGCATVGATIRIVLASWMIDGVDPKQRALANSAGVAATVMGGIVGGGAILYVGQNYSWTLAILSVSMVIALLSAPAWMRKATALAERQAETVRVRTPLIESWKAFFRKRDVWRVQLLILCFGCASGADVLVPAIMVDRGFSAAQTGWILGTFAMAAVIPATAIVGGAIRRYGTFMVMGSLYGLKLIVLLALAGSDPFQREVVAALAVADYFLSGTLTVATWQFFMNFASGPRSATDFSLVTSLDAALRFLGGVAAGQIGEALGYGIVFALSAMAAGAALLCCLKLQPLLAERE